MVLIFVLLLTAIIITQSTEVIKGLYNWIKETISCIKEKRYTEIKIGIPTSIALGLWAGVTIGVNIFSALFDATGIQYELNGNFTAFAIFATSLMLSLGSAGVINIFEQWKEGRKALEELSKQNKEELK